MGETTPHVCPVCDGRGVVPQGFYIVGWSASLMGDTEQCRSCEGTGIVWSSEVTELVIEGEEDGV